MPNKNNKISVFQLTTLLISLVVIGLLILISSGLFDSTFTNTNTNIQQSTTTAENNSGIDLNKINEINKLEEVVKSNPNNHEALLSLAHMLNDNGFYQRAVEKYEQYLSTHPENADVIVDLGVCYFELKNYNKSIEVIKSALKYEPKHQIAHFNLGIVNLANGNSAEAKSWWEKARDINPSSNIGKKAEELLKSN